MTQSLNPPFVIAPAPRRLYHRPIVRIVPGVAIGRFVYQFAGCCSLGGSASPLPSSFWRHPPPRWSGRTRRWCPKGMPRATLLSNSRGTSPTRWAWARRWSSLSARSPDGPRPGGCGNHRRPGGDMDLPRGDGGGGRFSVRSPKSLALPVVGKTRSSAMTARRRHPHQFALRFCRPFHFQCGQST